MKLGFWFFVISSHRSFFVNNVHSDVLGKRILQKYWTTTNYIRYGRLSTSISAGPGAVVPFTLPFRRQWLRGTFKCIPGISPGWISSIPMIIHTLILDNTFRSTATEITILLWYDVCPRRPAHTLSLTYLHNTTVLEIFKI